MKWIIFIGLGLGLGLTGCGRKFAPVSSHTATTLRTDSVSKTNTLRSDSVRYVERIIEKTLPGATIGVALTKMQLDSLIRALGTLPKGTPITLTDPKMRAQLQLVMDEMGNLKATCTALEYQYQERIIERERTIKELKEQNYQLRQQQTRTEQIQVREKKGFRAGLRDLMFWSGILLAIGVGGIVFGYVSSWIKRFRK
jgi:hypothetical protein